MASDLPRHHLFGSALFVNEHDGVNLQETVVLGDYACDRVPETRRLVHANPLDRLAHHISDVARESGGPRKAKDKVEYVTAGKIARV